TQPSSPPMFSTNIMTKKTRPKTMPKSRITAPAPRRPRVAWTTTSSGRNPRAAARRHRYTRGGRAGDHRPEVAEALVGEGGEGGDGGGQRAEPVLGPAGGPAPPPPRPHPAPPNAHPARR